MERLTRLRYEALALTLVLPLELALETATDKLRAEQRGVVSSRRQGQAASGFIFVISSASEGSSSGKDLARSKGDSCTAHGYPAAPLLCGGEVIPADP